MNVEVGSIIYSKSGHDKGRLFVVVDIVKNSVLLCDGNLKKIKNPKRKNVKHVMCTNSVISDKSLKNNETIANILRLYSKGEKNFQRR